jgi:hypothetical protein
VKFIWAGNYEQYQQAMRRLRLDRQFVKFLHSWQQLIGAYVIEIIQWGDWYESMEREKIEEELSIREVKLGNVREWQLISGMGVREEER